MQKLNFYLDRNDTVLARYVLLYSYINSFYSITRLSQFIHRPDGNILIAISANLDDVLNDMKMKIKQQQHQPAANEHNPTTAIRRTKG